MTTTYELNEVGVDGARLAYVDVGEGDPLVLLHGWPESHAAWRHQIGPLSQSRRVIAPDWQGWGASARDLRLSCDYNTEVDRIVRLFDALGLDRVDLACHDYGGFLGLGFVQRYPDRVQRFAILNSRAHRTFTTPYYQLFGLFSAAARRPLLRPLLTARTIGLVHRLGLAQFVRNGSFDTQRLVDYLDFLNTREGRRWYAHFWAGYSVRLRPELAAGLGAIDCPTSVIWGDKDPAIPFRYAEDLAAHIPNASLVRIDGGHFIMEQRPTEVTEALQAWLRRPTEGDSSILSGTEDYST